MPLWAPSVVAKDAERPRFSAIRALLVWSNARPPYSSGILAPTSPRSAACLTNCRAKFQSLASSSSIRGTTSASMNWRVVSAIMRCSSLKSSGVKISAGERSSIKKLPPLMISLVSITAAMCASFQSICRNLLADFIGHYFLQFGVCFQHTHQVEFVFLALGSSAFFISPGPDLPANEFSKRSNRHILTENFFDRCFIQKILITIVERDLNAQLATGHSGVQ